MKTGGFRLGEFGLGRSRPTDAHTDDRITAKAQAFSSADAAKHALVVHAKDDPAAERLLLRQDRIGCREAAFGIGGPLRRAENLVGADARGDDGARTTRRAFAPRVEAVEGQPQHARLPKIPAAAHRFARRLVAGHLADRAGRYAEIGNGGDRVAIGSDQPVVDRQQLEAIGIGAKPDRRAKLWVGRTNDEALGILCVEIVDRCQHPVAVLRTDPDQVEVLVTGGHGREAPLVLEPLLFGLLDEESDSHAAGRTRAPGDQRGNACRCRAGQEMSP